ncbi:DMT family transporter [Halomonas caseinilytica]|uniref:DMT family transporter n=1 Tax=Halomonas caseinilytica TaxID=438744 RepID=UPI0007E56CE5|nr:DMT family transporter [Halomonas caseinilytica]SEN40267.1 EamA-like transporter family protein [Halomonas caseinilytica]
MNNSDTQGILIIIAAVAAMATGDAFIKFFADTVPLDWLIAGRSILAVVLLLALNTIMSKSLPRLRREKIRVYGLIAVRSLLLALMWLCYYVALPNMSFSLAAALLYTIPVFICVFSTVLRIESLSLRRVSALVIGFAGVVVALQPWQGEVNGYLFFPIIAAALYALAQLLTRTNLSTESSTMLAAAMNVALFVVAMVSVCGFVEISPNSYGISPVIGQIISFELLLKILMLAVLISITATLTAKAFQVGSPTIVGVFDYSYLVFAAIWGVVLFSEVPSTHQFVGMLLIVVAGVLLLPLASNIRFSRLFQAFSDR